MMPLALLVFSLLILLAFAGGSIFSNEMKLETGERYKKTSCRLQSQLQGFCSLMECFFLGCSSTAASRCDIQVFINPACGSLKSVFRRKDILRQLARLVRAREALKTTHTSCPGIKIKAASAETSRGIGKISFLSSPDSQYMVQSFLSTIRMQSEKYIRNPEHRRIILLAGGDGFHRDMMAALLQAGIELESQSRIIPLPLGSGNDLPRGKSLEAALEYFERCLSSIGPPPKQEYIRITDAGGRVHYAFNVVSFGLDAYVCRCKDTLRRFITSEVVYRLLAGIAIPFYECVWKLEPWRIWIKNQNEVQTREGCFLLNIFCPSGKRTYGGGMNILPGDENYLLVQPLSLRDKLRLKTRFFRGMHYGMPIAEFFHADEVLLAYNSPILMQMDGECRELGRGDFPLKIERLKN